MALIALLICSFCNAQTSDFIVTTSRDTVYVDKITLTDFEVKTKTGDKKKKYKMDEVTSYYIFKENKYYEGLLIEKKEPKPVDKYDYRRNEDSYLEDYKNRINYKFLERLTVGKVKLFKEVTTGYISGSPGIPSTAYKNEIYYIAIPGSKVELINNYGKLKLTDEVYELLKIYLYGNEEITKKLDRMSSSKPVADEEQVISLINEYNIWAASNK